MTSPPLPPHDEDDDQDLRALYRSLPRTEPSAQLDAAVKQAAARAAAADRKVQQSRRHWHPGWGVAATVVLAVGLFFLTDLHSPDVALVSKAPPIDASLTSPPDTVREAPTHAPVPSVAPAPRQREYAAVTNDSVHDTGAGSRSGSASGIATASDNRSSASGSSSATSKQRSAPIAEKPAAAAESSEAQRERAPANALAPMPPQHAEPASEASPPPSADQSIASATRPSSAADASAKRITDIRALLQQGQREKALQALRDLQRDEPDLPLPDDLQQLLPK